MLVGDQLSADECRRRSCSSWTISAFGDLWQLRRKDAGLVAAGPLTIALGVGFGIADECDNLRNVTSDQQQSLGAECRRVCGALFAINDDWWIRRR